MATHKVLNPQRNEILNMIKYAGLDPATFEPCLIPSEGEDVRDGVQVAAEAVSLSA